MSGDTARRWWCHEHGAVNDLEHVEECKRKKAEASATLAGYVTPGTWCAYQAVMDCTVLSCANPLHATTAKQAGDEPEKEREEPVDEADEHWGGDPWKKQAGQP